jgi:hypothetical protein
VTKSVVRRSSSCRPAQPAAQLLAHARVERAERLVEQQHARLHRERTRERDALALAAGELIRHASREPIELDESQKLEHAALDLGLRGPLAARLHADPERDVLEHVHVAEQRVVLEHEPDAALARGPVRDVLVAEPHAARLGELEPRDDPEQRGLARSGRAE